MNRIAIAVVAAAGLGLSGCAVSGLHLAHNYGAEVRADYAAQIADPEPQYKGDPAPASSGTRTAGAQTRYDQGKVTPPASTSTSTVGGGGGGQ